MSILDEYRRNARECQRMAENAGNPVDKASWLRLAASWLGLIRNEEPRHAAPRVNSRPGSNQEPAWPKASRKDSQASH